jgi:hypothetical protein
MPVVRSELLSDFSPVTAARQALTTATVDTPAERLAWLHLAFGEAMVRGGPAGLDRINQRLPIEPGQTRCGPVKPGPTSTPFSPWSSEATYRCSWPAVTI